MPTVHVLDIPIVELTPHPELALFPLASAAQLEALTESIRTCGQLVPLSVKPAPAGGWHVVDGRNRLRAMADCGLEKAACILVESDPLDYAIETAVARRQLTKSGVILVLWLQHPDLAKRKGAAGNPNLPKHSNCQPLAIGANLHNDNTFDAMAAKYSVPRDYFRSMAEIAAKIGDDADAWAEVRRQILEEEISLPRLNAGIAGKKVKGGRRAPTRHDRVFRSALVGIQNAFPVWHKMPAAIRAPLADQWANALAHEELPDELRDRLVAALVTWPDQWRARVAQELRKAR